MTDWKQRSLAKRAARDAGIPKEYLFDLTALNIEPCPFEKETTPRTMDPDHPSKVDWKVTAAIYPMDSVMGIPRQLMDMQDIAITETSMEKLLALLSSSQLTSVRCAQAFLRRAILTHQLTNCCTEIFVDWTLKRAKECDDYLKENGKPIGSLHGLPVSLKDQFHIAGIPTTMGYVKDDKFIAKEHSVITEVLLRAGAVPLVRTNIPQTLMRGETDNHIYGRTVNPYNRAFTSGGSSGGEGALVAMHGSPLGLGTDIGGSVRIPAAFTGLWGMRTSMHRIPYEGTANSYMGQHTIYSVIGPLTHSHNGIVTFFKAVLEQRPWQLDPNTIPMPFDQEAYELKHLDVNNAADAKKRQLCFAIEWDDGVIHPHPPITRALKEVKAKLEAAGHKIIDWKPLKHAVGNDITDQIYCADGGEDIRRSCKESGEPCMSSIADLGEGDHAVDANVYASWQVALQRDNYRKEYLDHMMASASYTGTGRPVDAILAPVVNSASCHHNRNDYYGYTKLWNLLDYPVIVMPITHVDVEKDKAHKLDDAYSSHDQEMWDRYSENEWKGLPVCLGLVGKRLQDEELMGLAKCVMDSGATL